MLLNICVHLPAYRPVFDAHMGPPQLLIQRAPLQQFTLCALVHDSSLFQHHDLVGALDGAQPVCNDQQGLALGQCHNGPLDLILVLRVYKRGSVILLYTTLIIKIGNEKMP